MNGEPRVQASFANVWDAVSTLTPADYAEAEEWWAKARADVLMAARRANVTYRRMAFVFAVVSPGIPWRAVLSNVDVMLRAKAVHAKELPSGPGSGLQGLGQRGNRRGWAILNGGPESLASGPKVLAFAANLLGDMERVTVDRHLVRLATGDELGGQRSEAECARIALMVEIAAKAKGQKPAVLMAALWLRRAA